MNTSKPFWTGMLGIFSLMILSGCSVYHSRTATAEQAVKTHNKVKVHTVDQSVYKFKRLEMRDNQLVGITKKGSKAAKSFPAQAPVVEDGNRLKIPLDLQRISEIHTKNKAVSTILSVGIPIVTTFTVLLAAFATTVPLNYN